MRHTVLPLLTLLAAITATPYAASGQQTAAPQPQQTAPKPDFVIPKSEGAAQQPVMPPAAAVPQDRYVVGPQDTLAITVVGEIDLTNKYRVDTDGSITMPYIGRLAAAGSTIADLQGKITKLLKDGYLQNPQVLIDVDQYKSRSIYVTGRVRSPGKVPMNGPTITLIEALALAGSPTPDASNQLTVKHQRTGDVVTVNRRDLELGKAGFDIALEDGDVVNVPDAQRFYISGYIRNSGFYVLDPGMTIEQAIAIAGGLTDRGSDRRITVTRLVDGKVIELKVELADKVQANDVIKIPARFF